MGGGTELGGRLPVYFVFFCALIQFANIALSLLVSFVRSITSFSPAQLAVLFRRASYIRFVYFLGPTSDRYYWCEFIMHAARLSLA